MKNDLYKIFFIFLNNRLKHHKIQYNIINIYHIKYHIMPTTNPGFTLITGVRYLVLYRNLWLNNVFVSKLKILKYFKVPII